MIDWNKPVQTRDGRKAKVLCRDAMNRYPVVALVRHQSDIDYTYYYRENGLYHDSYGYHDLDLVNAPEETVRYQNVWAKDTGPSHYSLAQANAYASDAVNRLCVIKTTYRDRQVVKREVVG